MYKENPLAAARGLIAKYFRLSLEQVDALPDQDFIDYAESARCLEEREQLNMVNAIRKALSEED